MKASALVLSTLTLGLRPMTSPVATYTTVQEGVYWCSIPGNCDWGGRAPLTPG